MEVIQAAAQSHLQHHNIRLLPGVPHHGDGGHRLKLGAPFSQGIQGFHRLFDRSGYLGEFFLGDYLAVQLDPLPELDDIGGDEKTGVVTSLGEGGGGVGGGGTLAVGSGHVDKFQLFVGIAQPFQQVGDVAQFHLLAHGVAAVYEGEGLLIVQMYHVLYMVGLKWHSSLSLHGTTAGWLLQGGLTGFIACVRLGEKPTGQKVVPAWQRRRNSR